jgi:hypothetical protein
VNKLRYNNGHMVKCVHVGIAGLGVHWQSVGKQQLPFHRSVL